MKRAKTYPLRLPRSLKKAVELQSKEDGTSINQFVATAVAEKLSALQTAEYFASRKARADFKSFDTLMKRRRGTPPREGDEVVGTMGDGRKLTVKKFLETLPEVRERLFKQRYKGTDSPRSAPRQGSGRRTK
jgi:hypothetical protein